MQHSRGGQPPRPPTGGQNLCQQRARLWVTHPRGRDQRSETSAGLRTCMRGPERLLLKRHRAAVLADGRYEPKRQDQRSCFFYRANVWAG